MSEEKDKGMSLQVTKNGVKWIPFSEIENQRKNIESKILQELNYYVNEFHINPKYLYLGKIEYYFLKRELEDQMEIYNIQKRLSGTDYLQIKIKDKFIYHNMIVLKVNLDSFMKFGV